MSVVQCLFSLVFEYVNERKRIKQRKRWIFYKNEILTKWCVDRNFKVHECHRDRVFFFSSKKTVEPITGERAVLKFRSDKQRCLHEFQMSAWDRPESLRRSGYSAQQLLEASGRARVNRLLVENDLNTLIGWYENFSSVKVVETTTETTQSSINDSFSYALPFLALTKRKRLMCDFSLGPNTGWNIPRRLLNRTMNL